MIGADDRIRIGVIGVNGRGKGITSGLAKMPECEITYICDVDSRALSACQTIVFDITGKTPKGETDLRKLMYAEDVDAVRLGNSIFMGSDCPDFIFNEVSL